MINASSILAAHPSLFEPRAFAKALVAAAHEHCAATGEDHLRGDIEDTLMLVFESDASVVVQVLHGAAGQRLIRHSPYAGRSPDVVREGHKAAARLLATELDCDSPVGPDDRLCSEILGQAFSGAGNKAVERIVDALIHSDYCIHSSDFPEPYSRLFLGAAS